MSLHPPDDAFTERVAFGHVFGNLNRPRRVAKQDELVVQLERVDHRHLQASRRVEPDAEQRLNTQVPKKGVEPSIAKSAVLMLADEIVAVSRSERRASLKKQIVTAS